MEPFSDGTRLLLNKTLAIATLAIERQPGLFQSVSDRADMKALLIGWARAVSNGSTMRPRGADRRDRESGFEEN